MLTRGVNKVPLLTLAAQLPVDGFDEPFKFHSGGYGDGSCHPVAAIGFCSKTHHARTWPEARMRDRLRCRP